MDSPKPSAVYPFLRSCKQECEKPIEGNATGEIPIWVKGCLIRVGSGLLEIGPDKFNHVFDGMALLHRFDFQDGKVTYQNRFLRSDTYKDNMRANRIVVSEFGTRSAPDPCKTIFQRFASMFSSDKMTDNDLVNVVMYGNEAFACTESNMIWKIDTETLQSLQKVNLSKFLPIDGAIAHAHEGSDGTVYNIGTSYTFYPHYNIIQFPRKENEDDNPFENGSVICKIPASRILNPSYYHSFAMTDKYFIMIEQPLHVSIPKLACAPWIGCTYENAMQYDPNTPTRFHLVQRSDGHLLETSYISSSFFLFHHINAYEEDDHIIIDICAYENADIIKTLYVKALEEIFSKPTEHQQPFASRARRYVIPLNVDKNNMEIGKNLVSLKNCDATAALDKDGNVFCTFEILTGAEPWAPELPRVNYEQYNGKKYRYFYAVGKNENLKTTPHIMKVDTETKKTFSWGEDGSIPSEPVFLADPSAETKDEDSGVILSSLLYQEDDSKVSMLILNAKSMKEIGRVTFKTNSSVPGDFHGVFVPKH